MNNRIFPKYDNSFCKQIDTIEKKEKTFLALKNKKIILDLIKSFFEFGNKRVVNSVKYLFVIINYAMLNGRK